MIRNSSLGTIVLYLKFQITKALFTEERLAVKACLVLAVLAV